MRSVRPSRLPPTEASRTSPGMETEGASAPVCRKLSILRDLR